MKNKSKATIARMAALSVITWAAAALPQAPVLEPFKEDLARQKWFQNLPVPAQILADSALRYYDDFENQKSIQVLQSLQTMINTGELKKTSGRFRAWIYELLAANYYHLARLDSLGFTLAQRELVKSYVHGSLEENIGIWPEHVDEVRVIPDEIRILYQESWDEIYENFAQKRKSWRVGVGTIMRADFGYSLGFLDVAAGIGTTLDAFVDPETSEPRVPTELRFRNLLLFVRLQKMRKNLKQLTPGGYLEYSFSEDLTQSGHQTAHALSIGPVVGYAHPSGWEIGGSFEFARLIIGRESQEQSQQLTSQQIKLDESNDLIISYGYFEFYLRKWF